MRDVTIISLSGIYKKDHFWKDCPINWIDAEDITGTNCYCDMEAMEQIRELLKEVNSEGIHFIDSGNYHYMSRILLEKIQEPFCLLVFDNHTDMQLPAFGGLLSCGGWIADAIEEFEYLKKVILVGPDEEAYAQVREDLRKKVDFYSKEVLDNVTKEERKDIFQKISFDYPVYVSIDKDILNKNDADTTWSQGNTSLEQLLNDLQIVFEENASEKRRVLGIDICGEADYENGNDNFINARSNEKILDFLLKSLKDSRGVVR